jgi:hypothetical protein
MYYKGEYIQNISLENPSQIIIIIIILNHGVYFYHNMPNRFIKNNYLDENGKEAIMGENLC